MGFPPEKESFLACPGLAGPAGLPMSHDRGRAAGTSGLHGEMTAALGSAAMLFYLALVCLNFGENTASHGHSILAIASLWGLGVGLDVARGLGPVQPLHYAPVRSRCCDWWSLCSTSASGLRYLWLP